VANPVDSWGRGSVALEVGQGRGGAGGEPRTQRQQECLLGAYGIGIARRRTGSAAHRRGPASAAVPLPVKVEDESDVWVPRVMIGERARDRSQ
jgi:hypothetical protein